MTKSGSKYMKIKIEAETGKVVKIVDEKGNKATELTSEELQEIYQNKAPKHIGEILHIHSSPGCVIVVILGTPYLICW
jgi:hypothetical protein